MIEKRKLTRALSDELQAAGFARKGTTWRKASDEIVGVISLQKSNYDDSYFLNVGFWLLQLGEKREPKDEECHVQTRGDALWPDGDPSIGDLLTEGGTSLPESHHLAQLQTFARDALAPLVTSGLSKKGLVALVEQHDDLLIRRPAQEALGCPSDAT